MPSAPRPNEKAAKIAYKILKTPKELQQKNEHQPSEKKKEEWFKDSSMAQ